jgi:hypothetical protein
LQAPADNVGQHEYTNKGSGLVSCIIMMSHATKPAYSGIMQPQIISDLFLAVAMGFYRLPYLPVAFRLIPHHFTCKYLLQQPPLYVPLALRYFFDVLLYFVLSL